MAADRPTGDFGAKLRQARERKGISLRQIASATKIPVATLDALERNDVSRLPGGIFTRGFVRSYAAEIGLDPQETIEEFSRLPHNSVTVQHPHAANAEDPEAYESGRRTATTFVRLISISVPIVAAMLYFTTGREPPQEVASEPIPVAATTGSASALATDAPADVLSVNLLTTRECWVVATADGVKAIRRLLQPGERLTLEIRRELVLTTGDAGAIRLTLNGADARPLGADGQVVTTTFSLSNYRDYLLR